jgi:glycosyltransferase involved in cell wall biosynthesis
MLAIVTSHPIQYQVPLWRALAQVDLPFQVWYLTNHAVERSHDPAFGQAFAWDLDMLGGYPHTFLEVEPNWNLDHFRGVRLRESLAQRLRNERIRALWLEGWRFQALWQAIRAAHVSGTRVWLRGESNDLKPDAKIKSLIKRPVLSSFFRRVNDFLCIGSANRRLYESYGVPGERLHPAPYCVDNDRFRRESDELKHSRQSIRQSWRISPEAYCILFCGKFIPKKRPLDLVAALRRLETVEPHKPQLHLLFVGSGELAAELRSQCAVIFDIGKPAEVQADAHAPAASFVGFLNQMEICKAYVAADLLVLPSDHGETWGLVVNEAMACGTPAVVSDQCGCAEDLVAPLDRRLVFRCGDVDDLMAAICHVRRAHIGREQVAQASDTHHLRHTISTITRLYHTACRN